MLAVFHQTLQEQVAREPRAPGDWKDLMHRARWIDDETASPEFDALLTINVFDGEFPPSYSSGSDKNKVADRLVRNTLPSDRYRTVLSTCAP